MTDKVQKEPVSIWHDASEKSNEPEEVVIINPSDNTGEVSTRCTGVYSGRIWAYTSELLNLDNSCNIGKNLQEEPVSEDLEKEVRKYASIYYKDNDISKFARHFANWQKKQDQKSMEIMDEVYFKSCDMIRKQMIDKACKYLQDHREEVETEDNGISGWLSYEFIEDFENYMKG